MLNRDLVDILFDMVVPVAGLGAAFVAIAGIIALEWRDPVFAILAVAGVIVTAGRMVVILAYRRRKPVPLANVAMWERRYATGSYAFAVLLSALNLWALSYHHPLLHLITVSLVFAFGAGVVSRISMRPMICSVSLLLASVPTVIGLAAHALTGGLLELHTELFGLAAVILAAITGLSLNTVFYLNGAITSAFRLRHDLTSMAKQDALTGLPNRLRLTERFQDSIARVGEGDRKLAVHFLDLDGFKAVNDLHGHPTGDALLQLVSHRLTSMVRAEDTVARLGGDEFVVVQALIAHRGEAEMLARRVIKQLSAPYEVEGKTLSISVSIGIAVAPEQGLDLERLAACADAALYRSKRDGKGRFYFCSEQDAEAALRDVA